MRRLSIVLATVALSAFANVRGVFAQGNELVVMPNIAASTLSGVVHDRNGDPLEDVTITLFSCPSGEFRGLAGPKALMTTRVDAGGRFHLDWPKGKNACLQFQTRGFNTLQMEIRRSRDAGNLKPVLNFGM